MKSATERIGIIVAACLLAVLIGGIASAGPDPCLSVDGEIITCTGNQSQGIASSPNAVPPGDFKTPPANTLNVNSLSGPIQPTTAGTEGISFINYSGSGVMVKSGTSQDNVAIVTNGANAMGILVGSQGTPTSFTYRSSITIYVPNAGAAGGGAGGPVAVESYGTMTTDGSGSHGIVATNQTGGFPDYVNTSLNNFNLANITLSLETVAGSAGNIDCTVAGSNGGTFTLLDNGAFLFDPGSSFDNLAIGQVAITEINYQVRQTAASGSDLANGVLQVDVSRADNGALLWAATNHFDEYVGYDNYSTVLEETPLWPDLQSYVNGLKGDAGLTTDNAAGLFVKNYGDIETKGASSVGINAQTYGGAGASGRNGGGFWSFGTKEPTAGKQGANGGGLAVVHDGSIQTGGADSPGIFAYSRGGTGGKGGDGGFYYSGRQGGKGGTGGDIAILGSGTIVTGMDRSSGILAVSEGGVGGNGGGNSTWVDGGGGGYGGSAGSVTVDGAFNITTSGTESHGIWAKSIGGSGGAGGTGGVFGSGGGGGGASNGGNVSVTNAGAITTLGDYSHGIYAMSVGGFGGDGGNASGIFVSYGGSGSSAGNGGAVSVTNTETGTVSTTGAGSHAIFAQSIGGGGGSGGSASGIVGLGGAASAGGYGGTVTVVNNGELTTSGAGARGIYAQSIGGGGGDGGNSSGLVSIGGTGSATSDGGEVHVVNTGKIDTTSYSIFAQSVGGGGGDGGSSKGWFSIGGKGGGGGNADTVGIVNSGTLQTSEGNASAIFAQSVGGGGGNGGNSTAVGSIGSLSIGGSGATGGKGAMVTVDSLGGTIVTLGNDSRGIQAQSVGGGGGTGGFAFAVSGGLVGLSFAVGGQGGAGGSADNVTVDGLTDITTYGQNSHGIFAQSVGGGGGAGGFGIALSGGVFGGSFGMGGKGGTAGTGGTVTVGEASPLAGTIRTFGDHSYGILAQSVGGGGGDGGFSLAASAGVIGASLSFGGAAGTGGSGGDVTVRSANDNIVTIGSDSHGIVAQSVGGGGGTGGFSISGSAGVASVGVSFGGAGGNGGRSGNVEVSATGGEIRTAGYHSYGILAQSIGGSGGDGGYSAAGGVSLAASFNFAMGGSGGAGGNAGAVSVDSGVNIFTDNTDSHAIFAQSVGGGGGSGGFSATGGITGGVDIGASIGGSGGGGGTADNVAVRSTGATLRTSGERSYGILAQSVGGTGGDGGFAVSGGISGIAGINFAMGGSGGAGGNAGAVSVDSASDIVTDNNSSHAIFAQSVGGGGGSGGFSATGGISAGATIGASIGGAGGGGGRADNVTITSTGSVIQTSGERSYGILAQSIGGTGGDGGFSAAGGVSSVASVNFGMGGAGGAGGVAGAVSVDSASAIATLDDDSHAIFAQSVGGGGGSGGFSATGSVSAGVTIGAAIGGTGGDGAQAGGVTVTSTGSTIRTSGERSYGILAQSIGGTGGDGGFGVSGGVSGIASVDFAMGGTGGDGGKAGAVSVNSASAIATDNNSSHAIFAQSVGGGGGSGGFSATGSVSAGATVGASIGGAGGNGGKADNVTITSTGSVIRTSGERSYGILAQSIGGTGGDGGFSAAGGVSSVASVNFGMGGTGGAGGNAGAVSVNSASAIVTDNNSSHAIFAQSVGGGGGSGGFSATGGVSAGVTVGASIGGGGGDGATAGNVTVRSTGANIQTSGERSYGILAQSIGGTGGDGGFGVSGGVSSTASVDFAMGGSGGTGGAAGAVSVDSSSAIATFDNNSHAVFAQSVGGGGGSGGFSATGGVSGGATVGASIGGAGGDGARAGSVAVTSTGSDIQTSGERSYGILAQSVGGTGGDGGFSVAGGLSGTASVNFGMGGSGGTGGAAGAVSVDSASDIVTDNNSSHAIFAQSVGGGGGSGGFSVTAGISGSAAIGAAIGGSGGDGATADKVTVRSTGANIQTSGERSYGILAQSVGGTGGDGGFAVAGGLSSTASVNFGMGGSGGTGGAAGAVSVDSSSAIATFDNNSHGIFAQSVGGGGGSGGFSVTAGISGSAAIGAAVGGSGGDGATADKVTVRSTGANIQTSGERSYGILAQSVGGTGGDGGFSVAGGLASSAAVNFAMGGSGGTGGAAGAVSVDSSSAIATFDNNSHGIFAQSVGGGGGSGGFSVTAGISGSAAIGAAVGGAGGGGARSDNVTVRSTGSVIQTSGERSYGILAQSVGGTGGDGGFSVAGGLASSAAVNFAMGGSGGTGGVAGAVSVTSGSDIATFDNSSHAIFAQSVGGGGGSGGFSVTGGFSSGAGIGASIGGAGGDGAQAGSVTVASTGDTIRTSGERSYGILAQSIGGTGGDGGFSVAGGINKAASVNFSLGGSGGTGGLAGTVSVNSVSNIFTDNTDSHAIFAQSVGGGGGSGGFSVAGGAAGGGAIGVSIGGSGGDAGKADNVTVASTGTTIRTSGERSYGILAQSIGGTGGNGGFSVAGGISKYASVSFSLGGSGGAGGIAGAVSVDSASDIVTLDNSSHGIFAQSLGGGGGSGGFSVSGGAAEGAAVGISIGGSGGDGGRADAVSVHSTGTAIRTDGAGSYGILAQSIGGTGGNGGFSVAGGISKNAAVNFSLGGEGGAGALAGAVSVDSASEIATLDDDSHGIFAQSLGGGGGSGGFSVAGGAATGGAAVGISIGGTGGTGGQADNVGVRSTGATIRTDGERSYGILAQSIGGTGGNGGFSVAGGISKYASVNFGLGGEGGSGGIAGAVSVDSASDIVTLDNDSHGIFAQSLGGGGGSGGFSVAGSVSFDNSAAAPAVGISIGGSGGDGAAAGKVRVTNTGDVIQTSGERSYGILAQSIGGTGGNGGFSVAGGISKSRAVTFSLGGGGGTGSTGADVELASSGAVVTLGGDSHAIFAQSLGGSGGSGGFSVAGSVSADDSALSGVGVSIGGSGGGGGVAGNVTVNSAGDNVVTFGERAYGILAQSLGGGGGNGGFSVAGVVSKGRGVSFSMGGGGGTAGTGGTVDVVSSSNIVTHDNSSHAIFAQSVGGGGGSGGFSVAGSVSADNAAAAAIGISVGGFGAGGGNADNVTVGSTGSLIVTEGARSYGILAQSVGGGGGDGGFSVAGGIGKGGGATFSLGGFGDTGGAAGAVSVRSGSSIGTLGDDSHAIFAQSVGGGGGSGGFSVAGSLSADNSALGGLGISVGGFGGGGGSAGNVAVSSTGQVIETFGERSYGILAQSLGGGGGNGGFSVAGVVSKGRGISFGMGGGGGMASDGGAVDVDSSSDVVTHDNSSHAIFAQSVGGGGGSGGFSVAGSVSADNSAVAAVGISIGGSGGGGGNAGNVTVSNTSRAVETFGERSYGILAQSLGGGGGDGGFSVAGVASKGRGISFSMGGGGGTAGTGGTVAVDSSGDIATHDNNSHGIFAQSLGGGGGSGGFSVAGAISADNAAVAAIGISIGGFGAGGGNADNVTVDSTGSTIFTEGARSYGILAQSVGGGGGDGGFSVAGGIGKGGGATFSLGGFGDIGGHGRAVEVRNASDIGTLGEESHAIFAQSVGGGGGSGGFSVAGSVAWDNAAASVGISIGGFGGGGGNGDRVTVDNHGGFISTGGDNATGILAQSIGGGGGNGGFSIAGSFGFDNATKSVSVAVGGFGGKGGFGGDVDVSNSAAVVTEGNRSEGIFAQSIGGGGGSGGFAFAGTWGGAGSKNVSFSLGGYGGDGNYAGNVSVRNDNAIDTSGVQAHGIFAQSVGGGGGKGGWSIAAELGAGGDNTLRNVNLGVGIGGGGGDGGYGGAVSVANSHRIVTRGTESHGIFAQSIGGGGGNGGFAFSGMLAYGANDKGTNVNVAVAVGGGGGDGNHGGSVTVVNTGDIAALDNNSNGIFAQSLGGGGGNGGQASTFSMMFDKTCPIKYVWCKESKDGEDDWSFSVAVGGSGGGASNGGAVDVTNSGNIVTRGADSAGIFAQSIGGGGGTGGNGGSIGKSDILGMFAPEQLDFLFSTVSGFKEWDVMVGGSGGSSGNGDNVTVRNTGNITTYGSSTTMMDGTQLIQDNVGSYGIFAQSIGGGGGVGGNAATGLFGKIGLGGGAGSAGDGGAVKVENSGRIETFGDGGHAILAQSGGGGGGIAGDVERGKIPLTDINVGLNVAFGRGGGNSGDGGAVTVDSTGDIVTHGRNSFGIFAQSFGGGGGIAGNAGFLGIPLGTLYDWFAGSVGGDGSGGAVTVKSSGRIETFGDGSHGIFAQSAGGKGDGGTVHVDVAGDILAHGVGTDGIFAQSRGNDGGGNITVDINAGTVQGGTGAGAGVRIAEGANNTLTNRGTITTASGAAGNAVIGTKGNETIINHGTVTGSVDLGEGSNSFRNMAGATFNPGAKVQLGGGNTLTNDGILSPGGAGVVQTTVLGGNLVGGNLVGGNLVQSGTGKYEVDLDLRGGKADRIELDGIADLAGQVEVHLTDNLGLIPSGTHRYYILSGADNVNASGLALIYQPSAVMKYEMIDGEKDGEKYVELSTTVDFSPRGISLTGNQSAIGQAINAIQLAGGTEAFAPVVAELVRMTDPKNIALAYEQMNPVDYASFSKAIHDATRQYTQNLLKRVHSVRAGLQTADSRLERGDREQWLLAYSGADESIRTLTLPGQEERRKAARYGAWLDFFGQNGNQDAGHDANMINGYEFRTVGWSVGLDYLFGEKFLAGASIGTSGTDVDLDFQKGNGDIRGLFGSLYGSYFTRQFYLDMALSYGRQWFDNRRNYTFAGNPFTASSSHDGDLFSGYVEGGYNFQRKNWVLQPYAGLQYISLSEEAFSETGAGPLNLDVSKQNNGSLVSELGLRLEYVIPVETGNFLPEVTVAWSYDFGIDDPVVTASFAGAPGNSFSVTGRDGENCGLLVGAGVNFFGKSGFSTSLKYRGEFRDHYQSHAILGELIRYEF